MRSFCFGGVGSSIRFCFEFHACFGRCARQATDCGGYLSGDCCA